LKPFASSSCDSYRFDLCCLNFGCPFRLFPSNIFPDHSFSFSFSATLAIRSASATLAIRSASATLAIRSASATLAIRSASATLAIRSASYRASASFANVLA
jgi:hypothetical protein